MLNIHSEKLCNLSIIFIELIGLECGPYCLESCFVYHAWGVKMVAKIGKKED